MGMEMVLPKVETETVGSRDRTVDIWTEESMSSERSIGSFFHGQNLRFILAEAGRLRMQLVAILGPTSFLSRNQYSCQLSACM